MRKIIIVFCCFFLVYAAFSYAEKAKSFKSGNKTKTVVISNVELNKPAQNENIKGKDHRDENDHNTVLPTVVVVSTGGTIAEKTDQKTGASMPYLSGEDLVDSVPMLKKLANIKVVNFSNIDSSQMTPEMWANLSKVVDRNLADPNIAGAVITHGTDTMAEGAFFLDVTIKSKKPVVFVGAMRNSSDPYSDGPPNLLNGIVQVLSDQAKNWGVTVTMNQYVNSPIYVEKTQTSNIQTFESGEKGYLGYVNEGRVYRINDRLHFIKLPIPDRIPNVILFTDYAGADGKMLKCALDAGVDGIVVESLGSGNVNAAVFDVLKEALDKGIPVVVTSRVYHGSVYPEYGVKGGGQTLKESGAVVCGSLHGPKARLLLSLVIAHVGKNQKDLGKYFDIP